MTVVVIVKEIALVVGVVVLVVALNDKLARNCCKSRSSYLRVGVVAAVTEVVVVVVVAVDVVSACQRSTKNGRSFLSEIEIATSPNKATAYNQIILVELSICHESSCLLSRLSNNDNSASVSWSSDSVHTRYRLYL